jgi:hypothetical protein
MLDPSLVLTAPPPQPATVAAATAITVPATMMRTIDRSVATVPPRLRHTMQRDS